MDCQWCGIGFLSINADRVKFCSRACRGDSKTCSRPLALHKGTSHRYRSVLIKFCKLCNKSFDATSPNNGSARKYCSYECSALDRRKSPTYSRCLVCGDEFRTRTRRTVRDANKCCSRECGFRYGSMFPRSMPMLELQCTHCGGNFKGMHMQRYCSLLCKNLHKQDARKAAREKLPSLICNHCGEWFKPWRLGLKYCGKECSEACVRRERQAHYDRRHKKNCILCGKAFKTINRSGVRYCSKRCGSAANKNYSYLKDLDVKEVPSGYIEAVAALRQLRQKADGIWKEGA